MSPSTGTPQDAFRRPTAQPYRSHRDHRFEYVGNAIEAIEKWNCSKGCTIPSADSVKVFGPGGNCELLSMVAIGDYDIPIPDLLDNGKTIRCTRRQPLPPPPPPPPLETLFDEPS